MKYHPKVLEALSLKKKSDAYFLELVQKFSDAKEYEELGYRNLHEYLTRCLKLTESEAYSYHSVIKKSVSVPELKEAVLQGELSLNTARKIVSVIQPENKEIWLEKAKTLKQKDLEKEIVKVNPRKAVREGIKPVAKDICELKCAVTLELEELIRRVQDLESQRTKKACTLEETLQAMASLYLEKNDPIKKAERVSARRKNNLPPLKKTRAIPQAIQHQINLRDQGKCVVQGCTERRWLEKHHAIPYAHGGGHTLGNLSTLCHFHHKRRHERIIPIASRHPSNETRIWGLPSVAGGDQAGLPGVAAGEAG